MTITIMHLKADLDPTTAWSISGLGGDRVSAARTVLAEGGYEAVAEFQGDDLEEAYRLTQNGVASPSWSRFPPEGLKVLSSLLFGGEERGRKSSQVGDVFVKDGVAFVVDTFGFKELGPADPSPAPGRP
jgi:hypothetical protein